MHAHAKDFRDEVEKERAQTSSEEGGPWGEEPLAEMHTALIEDYRQANWSPQTRALLDFAAKLTRRPAEMQSEDLDALRQHGFDDRAINDATQVISYFNYINRIADALDVELEPEMPVVLLE